MPRAVDDLESLRERFPPSHQPGEPEEEAWPRVAALRALGLEGPFVWGLSKYDTRRNCLMFAEQISVAVSAAQVGQKYGPGRYRMTAYEWPVQLRKPIHKVASRTLYEVASVDFEVA